jgi:diguanylate cyclase (GGDEF)-like protein
VATVTPSGTQDVVSLAERFRFMQWFRAGAAAAVVAGWLAVPEIGRADGGQVISSTAVYLALTLTSELLYRALARQGRFLFTGMLIVDSLYLGWVAHLTAGPTTPLRSLVLLHLIAVALLASFRTGLRMALWHSMVLFGMIQAAQTGLIPPSGQGAKGGTDMAQHVAFASLFWAVAIVTSTFAAVNERELRRRRYDLEALARLAAQLEKAEEPGAVAEALVDAIGTEFDIQRVMVLGTPGDDPALLAVRGVLPGGVEPVAPGPRSLFTRATGSNRTMLVRQLNPTDDPWLAGLLPDARNLVVVPMIVEGRAKGIVVVEHAMRSGSRIERRIVSMLERFASQSALALGGAWLLEQVRQMATMDGLTGVANRRSFDSILAKELARADRNSDRVSLILTDIDFFKKLNDTLGHQAGDRVLVQVAGVLARHVRISDTVARYGGEEFAVILPGLQPSDSHTAAEKLRKAVEHLETLVPVTVSLGVATYPDDAPDGVSLIQAADKALYASKRGGRNQYTLASQLPPDGAEEPEAKAEAKDGDTQATDAGEPASRSRG